MTKNFVHLRTYSDYSLGYGAIKVKDLVKASIKNEMPALALTDQNNLFASLEFSLEASKSGVQPIIGIDITVRDLNNKFGNILLLAKNDTGYQNLLSLASELYLSRSDHSLSLSMEILLEKKEGLICLCGGLHSLEAKYFAENLSPQAVSNIKVLAAVFGDDLFIELFRSSEIQNAEYEKFLLKTALELNIPVVATNYAAFLKPEYHEAQDAIMCISQGRYMVEDDRPKVPKDFYFKSASEMRELFHDIPEAILNTHLIAERCLVMSEARNPMLPSFTQDGVASEDEALKLQSINGLEKRISHINDEVERKIYFDRLEFELSVIHRMKYSGYFLIVSDFIKWSKQNGIPVGPGRGSGAGSVVAWCLEITDLDPLRFGLLFERFLNPDRVSMPDFDIDFCQDRREEVIAYVRRKYGEDRVAQIITFGKLQARAVLRDVGRVLQLPYPVIDRICKMVPNNPANPVTLKEAIDLDKELQKTRDNDPDIERLLRISLELEGLNRHVSTHAAGIVIADRSITELVPLYKDLNSEMCAVQYSMKYAESAGLVKFDFLGLKTLTVISWACALIKKIRGEEIDISLVPLEDSKTYQLLSSGNTTGVFQFESAGMKEAIKKLRPDRIDDLIALGSLYRPGPMDNIPSYINRKHGYEKAEYLHPLMEEILKETYGIIVYQEQVMEIAKVLAGYTLGSADLLRRAMGKKIKAEMEAQRAGFVEGCEKNNINKKLAEEIFALIEKFASYGFNKSHAAAYALISYQTAYLKANYAVEFLVASINLEINDTDKINIFIEEAKKFKIEVLPPCINNSEALFTIENNKIRFGLGALKNVGTQAVSLIVEERSKNGKFKSMFDFFERSVEKSLNKRMVEGLAKGGAFDSVYNNRQEIFENAELLTRYASNNMQQKQSKQVGLFDMGPESEPNRPALQKFEEYTNLELLSSEFEAFGFYLSSHPLESYSSKIAKLGVVESTHVEARAGAKSVKINVAGVITSKKIRSSQRGKFAFIQLSDRSGLLEVSVFNEALLIEKANLLEPGQVLLLKLDVRQHATGLRAIVDDVIPIEEAVKDIRTYLEIHVDNEDAIKKVSNSVNTSLGKPFHIVLNLPDGSVVKFKNTSSEFIAPDSEEKLRKTSGIKILEH